jgi:hypothetical protein
MRSGRRLAARTPQAWRRRKYSPYRWTAIVRWPSARLHTGPDGSVRTLYYNLFLRFDVTALPPSRLLRAPGKPPLSARWRTARRPISLTDRPAIDR